MENKTYARLANLSSLTNNSNPIINPIALSLLSPTNNSAHLDSDRSRSNLIITHPTVNRLSSETIKQEEFEPNSASDTYPSTARPKNTFPRSAAPTVVTAVPLNPREVVNGRSILPMANVSSHLMSALSSGHLADAAGKYYLTGLTDLGQDYKLPSSSNTDIPSPSSSSNSSNPPSTTHHQHPHHSNRRHTEGHDVSRKREMRLQKNREAARECRRKKKEYIKCLEERVAGLENQNRALIEELRQLKELYCQHEDTNNKNNNNNSKGTAATGTSSSTR